jgi:hypothetical protein
MVFRCLKYDRQQNKYTFFCTLSLPYPPVTLRRTLLLLLLIADIIPPLFNCEGISHVREAFSLPLRMVPPYSYRRWDRGDDVGEEGDVT